MHIVFVSREYPPTNRGGGIASYVRNMACYYASLGHTVTVVAASDDTRLATDIISEGVRVIRLSGGDFLVPQTEGNNTFKKFRCLYRFHSYRKKIRSTILSLPKIDIIEVAEFGAEAYSLKNLPIPVIIRLHTPTYLDRNTFERKHYPITKFYERWCASKEEQVLKKAKYITSCSISLKDWCVSNFKLNSERIKVIYNPVHLKDWIIPKANSTTATKGVNILFAGTVAIDKGIGDLVEACKLLKNSGENVKLTIAGKMGNYGISLKESLIDDNWCLFTGHISHKELKELYKSHDIACFPSWWDNMPMVCIEAMATPMLTIGSKEGGMSEIIEDGVDGFLIEPKRPADLAKKIREVHGLSAEQKETICKSAHKKILEKFEMSHVGKQMLDYYETIIKDFKNENTLG